MATQPRPDAPPVSPRHNPYGDRAAWEAARAAAHADPGAFHGEIAARELHWCVGADWLTHEGGKRWTGWDAAGVPVERALDADFTPWEHGLDDREPPFYRWFSGGRTNAAFNEVDRHVLAGHGAEAAIIFEGDRWDMAGDRPLDAYPVSRRTLLLESAKCALALKALGLVAGDRIALNMPNVPEQLFWTEGAKRAGIIYTPVFGGFSDKTLSDRIHDAGAKIVVTADGGYRMAQIIPFKTVYTDPALDGFVGRSVVLATVKDALARFGATDDVAASVIAGVEAATEGDITVARSDAMRGVGRALAGLELDAEAAAAVRVAVAEALVATPARVEAVVVVRHAGVADLVWRPERDRWAHDLTGAAEAELLAAAGLADRAALDALDDRAFTAAIWKSAPPLPVEANFPLFFIYTSGSTGKPKGVVHGHGGWLAGVAHTMRVTFDAGPGDVLYVVADPGWITGQSYMFSGALATRVTSLVTEGPPVFPHAGRWAASIQRHGVTLFKAGVTFLKGIMADASNLRDLRRYDLSGLKAATFCAEPVSPAAHAFAQAEVTPWYVNSYWATEHGGIAWTQGFGTAGMPLRADARCFALPWVMGDVWVEDADASNGYRRAADGEKGEIVIAAPYPYLACTVWSGEGFAVEDGAVVEGWNGDAERWRDGYWGRWRGTWAYTQGDFAVRDADGGFSLHGRSDDVINVSGHRMGTAEIEGAILRDKALDPDSPVGNVLVVGAPHAEKGLTPLAFVVPAKGRTIGMDDKRRLTALVREEKGAVAVPEDFIAVEAFPETRSGKYMRRMVRALVEGQPLGDVSTLANPESVPKLKAVIEEWQRKQNRAAEQTIFDRYRYFRVQYNRVAPGKRVATVFVTNPPVNALNARALDELNVLVDHLAAADDVVAVVFTGDGNAFVAGADVKQLLDEVHDLDEALALPRAAQRAFGKIEAMDKPCIAAINGVALGGGLEFALACHYRIAEPHARFGQPEIRLRLLPGYGGTQRLPRLLADVGGEEGLRAALDMIFGGRSIGAAEAEEIGLVDLIASDSGQSWDAFSLAHKLTRDYAFFLALNEEAVRRGRQPLPVRDWVSDPQQSDDEIGNCILADALAGVQGAIARWAKPATLGLDSALTEEHLVRIAGQTEKVGRSAAHMRVLDAVQTGWTRGMSAGLLREAELFAAAILDPVGGKAGIRLFLDKQSPALPVRRDGVFADSDLEAKRGATLEAAGHLHLLPRGAAFFPGVTAVPEHQYAFGIARSPDTGEPGHGPPATHERELIVPVERPEANEALVYMLTSEVNFNDIWALTGIPVSPFDSHDEDFQTTGSGGIGLVAALGQEARRDGRLKVGDLVQVYSGTSALLSPMQGRDPMFADFAIQGYETPTGSHAQFLVTQAPQLHPVPEGLTLEAGGAYVLNLGTVWRCLFTTLDIRAGGTIFVEGSATGTGLDALKTAIATGVRATGLVSSAERAAFVAGQGAAGAIDRTDPRWAAAFTAIPEDPAEWPAWEAAGEPIQEAFRALNDGKLADYAVSHAGETAFPRTFQMLGEGGKLAFYGASSGYHFTFMGKSGSASPEDMLSRAGARGGEAALLFYGPGSRDLADRPGLAMIEAARAASLRLVVATTTDGQREFIQSLGFEDAIEGVVSIEELRRRFGAEFDWPATMPRLPVARDDIAAFRAAVRDFQERTMKRFGAAIGKALAHPGNPRGSPDIVFERAGFDSLGVSSALVKPFTGRIVYWEQLAGRRFSFYAPQVWTRQKRILMPTAEILGTHLCNAYEVTRMNEMVAAGLLKVTEPTVVPWEGLPQAHQAMWENRHGGATYVVNHALPELGLRSKEALFEAWAAREADDDARAH